MHSFHCHTNFSRRTGCPAVYGGAPRLRPVEEQAVSLGSRSQCVKNEQASDPKTQANNYQTQNSKDEADCRKGGLEGEPDELSCCLGATEGAPPEGASQPQKKQLKEQAGASANEELGCAQEQPEDSAEGLLNQSDGSVIEARQEAR